MPRPGLPPTPGSSTDIKGKDGIKGLSSMHMAFELPPPAIHGPSGSSLSETTKHNPSHPGADYSHPLAPSPRSIFPSQSADTVKSRRRSSAAKEGQESSFALPPPPTRSRKIIQMKPRQQDDAFEAVSEAKDMAKSGAKGGAAKNAAGGATTGTKKKQPSATSAAGRKIARKTAHSLIERRRRSKMNEEFAVLKSMIPACTGEMHKLAILQASIDYLRYLEDCVSKLQAQHGENKSRDDKSLPSIRDFHPTFHPEPTGDIDMSDSEDTASPLFTGRPDHSHQSSVSPGIHSEDGRRRQPSYSAGTDRRHYSFSTSAGTSPAFGSQPYGMYGQSSAPGSALTSPALDPQSELDHEATAALLMLTNDRRGTNASANGRGLSVRDLLST